MITRRSLLVQTGALALGAVGAWWLRDHVLWPPPVATFASGAASSGWLPFASAPDQGLVTTLAGLGDAPVRVLVDTGAQASVIDRAFALAHGLGRGPGAPMIAYGVGGRVQLAQGVRIDLTLGDLTLMGLNAAMVDLGPIAGVRGLGTPLVLGQDALSRLVADIDFPARRLALTDPDRYQRPAHTRSAPVRRRGRGLAATITLEGRPLDVALDTGSSGALSLTRRAAAESGLLEGPAPRASSSIVLGGVTALVVVTAKHMSFAGRTWRDLEVSVFDPPPAPGFPKGLLGVQALAGSRAILDIGAGRLDLT